MQKSCHPNLHPTPTPAENCTYNEFWGILRLLLSVLLWVLFVVYGNWQPWSTWSSCSSTCGHGTMTRTRHCDTEPTHPCQGQSSEEYTCNNAQCGESNCCASFVSSTSSPMGLNYVFFQIIHNKEKFNVYSEFFFSHLFWIKSLCVIWKFFLRQTVYYILKDIHVHVYKVRHQTSKKVHVVDNGHKSVFQT